MSNLIYSHIKTQIKNRLHNPNLSDDNLDIWVNTARDKMIRDIRPSFALKTKLFTGVADQATYNIPDLPVGSVREIVNVTNDEPLIELTEFDINTVDVDRADGPDSKYFYVGDISYILAQPTAASKVALSSSSIADASASVLVRGFVSGIEVTETVTLDAVNPTTTPVDSAYTYDIGGLVSISLPTACTGTITSTSNAAAVTNIAIPAGLYYVPHTPITIWGTPSAAGDSFRIHYYKSPFALSNDGDPLGIPSDWNSLLIDISLVEAHRHGYEIEIGEVLLIHIEKEIKAFAARYQKSRVSTLSMVNDRVPSQSIRSDKPVG